MRRKVKKRKYIFEENLLNVELLANAIYFDDEYLVNKVKELYDSEYEFEYMINDIKTFMMTNMEISEEEADNKINNFINKHYAMERV